jgi:hypothetical protein
VLRVLRAVVGLAVLVFLLWIVNGWWKEYKAAPSSARQAPATSTSSPSAAAGGSEKPAETSPADKTNQQSDTLVVLVKGVKLRTAPASDARVVRELTRNQKLVLLKKGGEWYRSGSLNGTSGGFRRIRVACRE